MGNVYEFRARPRKALTNRAALQFLREQASVNGQDGWLNFTSYADLADALRWDKSRAWKACQAWKKTTAPR